LQHRVIAGKAFRGMTVIITCLHVAIIFFLAWVIYTKGRKIKYQKLFVPALALKLLAGVAMGCLYIYYYKAGDTLLYFQDGSHLAKLAKEDPATYLKYILQGKENVVIAHRLVLSDPRALFMSKIVSVFCLLTFNNYWVISLYFSFLSFLAAWSLVCRIDYHYKNVGFQAVIAFLIFPSIIFWSSGIIKETLVMAGIFYLSAVFLTFWNTGKVSFLHMMWSFLFVFLVWTLKYYVAAIFFPAILAGVAFKLIMRFGIRSRWIEGTIWLLVFIVPLLVVISLRPNFYPSNFLHVVLVNYEAYLVNSDPQDVIHYNNLSADWLSVLKNIPLAITSGLFRPFIWEASNPLQMLIGAENFFILLLALIAIPHVKQIFLSEHRILLISLVVYVLLLCVFMSLSTPNFGTLSRYRTAYLPFFVFVISLNNPVVKFVQSSFQRLAG
jgi:hypothetical protein